MTVQERDALVRDTALCRFTWSPGGTYGCAYGRDWIAHSRKHICIVQGPHRKHHCTCGVFTS